MAVQESNDVNVSVEQIAAAYASEDFARFVCNEVGVNFVSFNLDGDPAGEYTITTERTIPADRVPDIAKKFVSNGVGMTQTDKVSAPAADGTRTVNTEVKVSGMPVSAQSMVRSPARFRWWARRLLPLPSLRLVACSRFLVPRLRSGPLSRVNY